MGLDLFEGKADCSESCEGQLFYEFWDSFGGVGGGSMNKFWGSFGEDKGLLIGLVSD